MPLQDTDKKQGSGQDYTDQLLGIERNRVIMEELLERFSLMSSVFSLFE
jgi:hypothetical protein